MLPSLKLGTKLAGVHILALVVALASIGLTLHVSWRLEGGAAAINDAGSLRMHAYRLASLAQDLRREAAPPAAVLSFAGEIAAVDAVVRLLRSGDPARPLFVSRSAAAASALARLDQAWSGLAPALTAGAAGRGPPVDRRQVEAFVTAVNDLVGTLEGDLASTTALLRGIQLGLITLAIGGAGVLLYLAYRFVVQPVTRLHTGLERMAQGDFSARVPVGSGDEFGVLAAGFNRLATRLEASYRDLEERVAQKTLSLAEQNTRVSTLYDMAAFLNTPGTQEDIARGFIARVLAASGADAAAVRLVGRDGSLHFFVEQGLPPGFAAAEGCLRPGECACGKSAVKHHPVVHVLTGKRLPLAITLPHCKEAGFATVAAFPVAAQHQALGVFTLLYRDARELSHEERHMLESLAQHLGVAIESVRVASADRELAIAGERNLLAQELHDSIAQSLAFLNLQVQMLRESMAAGRHEEANAVIAEIDAGVRESYADVRELLVHFRTRVMEGDLERAIGGELAKFSRQTGIATHFTPGGAAMPLAPDDQLQVMHILHEALANVRKHARAKRVEISAACEAGYRFVVQDDGIGFDTGHAPGADDGHVGLRIMRERAGRVGGELAVESRPGAGTTVVLTLPALAPEARAPSIVPEAVAAAAA